MASMNDYIRNGRKSRDTMLLRVLGVKAEVVAPKGDAPVLDATPPSAEESRQVNTLMRKTVGLEPTPKGDAGAGTEGSPKLIENEATRSDTMNRIVRNRNNWFTR